MVAAAVGCLNTGRGFLRNALACSFNVGTWEEDYINVSVGSGSKNKKCGWLIEWSIGWSRV